ncbi:MAG: hypothetical protein LBR73_07430 [Oscillospiraceae bacterium]|jgi:hypothetical protein|nr:hypothetical protein [Oscillospiraceae bacterium]
MKPKGILSLLCAGILLTLTAACTVNASTQTADGSAAWAAKYRSIVDNGATADEEPMETAGFTVIDLDGNGTPELLVRLRYYAAGPHLLDTVAVFDISNKRMTGDEAIAEKIAADDIYYNPTEGKIIAYKTLYDGEEEKTTCAEWSYSGGKLAAKTVAEDKYIDDYGRVDSAYYLLQWFRGAELGTQLSAYWLFRS